MLKKLTQDQQHIPAEAVIPKIALNLEKMLPYRLRALNKRLAIHSIRLYASQWGLSNPEWYIVAVLGAHAPLSPTKIAAITPMGKPQISRTLRKLEKRGLITIHADRNDGRCISIWLTAEGARIHDGIAPRAILREDKLLDNLTNKEIDQIDNIIKKLNQRMDEFDKYCLSDSVPAKDTDLEYV